MSEFKGLVVNFMIVALLMLSLFSFMMITQEDNNAIDPIKNNQIFNNSFNDLSDSIDSSTSQSKDKYDVFNSEEPKTGFGSIVLFGIVSVGKTFSGIIFGTFKSIIKFPLIVLGIPATVISMLVVILIISVIVGVWLLYKLGG